MRVSISFTCFFVVASVYEDKAIRDKIIELPKIVCAITGKGTRRGLRRCIVKKGNMGEGREEMCWNRRKKGFGD